MAPPTYNASKHHIGLGARGGTSYGWMILGGYQRDRQREGLGGMEFGGQSDLIGQVGSLSRWTQDDFVGGAFAYNWGKDDAMYADSKGFMPMMQGKGLTTCPPMYFMFAKDPDTETGFVSDVPKSMFMVAGVIYVVFGHGILSYNIVSGVDDWYPAAANSTFVYADYEPTDGVIWAMCNSSVPGDRPSLQRINTDFTDPSFDAIMIGPSGTNDHTCYGASIKDSMILAQIGRKLYLGDPPDNPSPTVNGTIDWTLVGRLPGRFRDAVAYNGYTYILVNDGLSSPTYRSYLYAFDGTNLMPVCQIPAAFMGKTMVDYGGRLFVGGVGTDVNGNEQYAELYEVTGSSVRCVRTFEPETRTELYSSGEWPQSIDDLIVHENLLWFAQKGSRMMVYDTSADGFHGAAEIPSNADLYFPKMTAGRGRIWAWGVDPSDDTKHGLYRIAQAGDAGSVAAWQGWLETSDFLYEPAVKKRWSEIVVQTRYDGLYSLEYSVDSGETWTALTVTESIEGNVYYSKSSLAAITPSKHIRFRIKVDTTDGLTYHKELLAYTVAFTMLDTGKKAWSFSIIGGIEIETLDAELAEATTQTYDLTDVASTLWGWSTNETPLTFTDLDGATYDVHLTALRETMSVIGPDISGESRPESLYHVTLLEI